MKKTIIKVVLVLLIILEGIYIILPNHKLNNKIEQVSYENNNISNNSTLAYYLDGEPQENRNAWPTDSPDIAYYKAECYDENDSPIESSEVVSFNYEDHTATITTKKTVYCSLYFASKTSPIGALILNSGNDGKKYFESDADLTARNKTITGNFKDDLRRFVGTYSQVKNNFICFGTDSQQTCKDNKDTYMYRIIGIDTEGRLKIIKATKLVQGSTSTFQWHNSYSSDITWPNSDLYKRLNGTSTNTSSYPNIFIGNEKYNSYMSDIEWTKLIDTPTYYIGDEEYDRPNPTLFQSERTKSFTGNKIGLMYLSDYLYANKGTADTNNWLFIQNGLNRASNTPSGSITPTNDYEWTMTRYGKSGINYRAWLVSDSGNVTHSGLDGTWAVRPVIYLETGVSIGVGGEGSIENPYVVF